MKSIKYGLLKYFIHYHGYINIYYNNQKLTFFNLNDKIKAFEFMDNFNNQYYKTKLY